MWATQNSFSIEQAKKTNVCDFMEYVQNIIVKTNHDNAEARRQLMKARR